MSTELSTGGRDILSVMDSLFSILKDYTPSKAEGRKEIILKFAEKINLDRKEKKYKELPVAFFGMKMKHLDLWDLKIFYGSCCDAKNFVSFWWWALDTKNCK